MIAVRFEESRAHVPVPYGCSMWKMEDGKRIPVVHMESQHLMNLRKRLHVARSAAVRQFRTYRGMLDAGYSPAVEALDYITSRIAHMDLWYDRFGAELERRVRSGETIEGYTARVSKAGACVKTIGTRLTSVVNCIKHLLRAPKEGARNK